MVDLLKALCRRKNVMEIWVGTSVTNTPAKALYESTGARPVCDTYVEYVYSNETLTQPNAPEEADKPRR